ncbi:MAG: RNA polymerase sigma factor [Nannocystaceae bacterium]
MRSLLQRPDTELLAGIHDGDPRAMEALLRRYQPQILRVCRRILQHPEDAREAGQDALLAVARGLGSFRGGAALSTWIYAVTRSFCLKRLRRSKFAPQRQDSLEEVIHAAGLAAEGRIPEEHLCLRELRVHLDRALWALGEQDREIVLLRDHEGLRADEVAARLGLSVAAVKSRLHRARLAIRRTLGRLGLGLDPGRPPHEPQAAAGTAWVAGGRRGRPSAAKDGVGDDVHGH